MNIQSTRLQQSAYRPVIEQNPSDSQSFGMNFDPFSGVKQAVGDVVELGMSFGLGALPGVGIKHHGEIAIMGGFNGRGNSDTKMAVGGAALNGIGSIGLVVAAGQYAFGGDPSLALGISAGALAGSGLASVILMR
jgi:hypothetical protein